MNHLQVFLLIGYLVRGMSANELLGSGSGESISPSDDTPSPSPTPSISLPTTPSTSSPRSSTVQSTTTSLLLPFSVSVTPSTTSIPHPSASSASQQTTASPSGASPAIIVSTTSPIIVTTIQTLIFSSPSILPVQSTSTPSQLTSYLPSPTSPLLQSTSFAQTIDASPLPQTIVFPSYTFTPPTSPPATPTVVAETTTPIPAASLTMTQVIIIAAVGGAVLVGVVTVLLCCCVVLVRRKKRSNRFVLTTAGSSSNLFPMYKGGELGTDQPDILASPPLQDGIINFGVNLTTDTFGIASLPTSPEKATDDDNLPALVFINAVDPTIPIVSNTTSNNYSHTLPTKKRLQRSDLLGSFEAPVGASAAKDLENSFESELKASKSTGAINVVIDAQSLCKNPQLDDLTGQKANKGCVQPHLADDTKQTETPESALSLATQTKENDGYVFLQPLGKPSEHQNLNPILGTTNSHQEPGTSSKGKFVTESLYDVPRAVVRAKVGEGGEVAPKVGESMFLPTPDTSHYDVPRKLLAALKKESSLKDSTIAPSADAATPTPPVASLHESTAPSATHPPLESTAPSADTATPSGASTVPSDPATLSEKTSSLPLKETQAPSDKKEKDVSSVTPQPLITPTMLQEKLATKPKKPTIPTRKTSLDTIEVAARDDKLTKLLETANSSDGSKSSAPLKGLVEENGSGNNTSGRHIHDSPRPVPKKRGERSPVSPGKLSEGEESRGKGNDRDMGRKEKTPDKVVEAPENTADKALNGTNKHIEKPKLKPKPSAKTLQPREPSPSSENSNAKPSPMPRKSGHAPLTRELAISLTEK